MKNQLNQKKKKNPERSDFKKSVYNSTSWLFQIYLF